MGLTPLAGVEMGTRSGDIDPAIPLVLQKKYGYSAQEMDDILNKNPVCLVSAEFPQIPEILIKQLKKAIIVQNWLRKSLRTV